MMRLPAALTTVKNDEMILNKGARERFYVSKRVVLIAGAMFIVLRKVIVARCRSSRSSCDSEDNQV